MIASSVSWPSGALHAESDLGDFVAVVEVDGTFALGHFAAIDTCERRCAVAALHVGVLLVCEVGLGLGWGDRNGSHDDGWWWSRWLGSCLERSICDRWRLKWKVYGVME
jgi:hypothetical protein